MLEASLCWGEVMAFCAFDVEYVHSVLLTSLISSHLSETRVGFASAPQRYTKFSKSALPLRLSPSPLKLSWILLSWGK